MQNLLHLESDSPQHHLIITCSDLPRAVRWLLLVSRHCSVGLTHQEAWRVVQEAAEAAHEVPLQEGRVLWRKVFGAAGEQRGAAVCFHLCKQHKAGDRNPRSTEIFYVKSESSSSIVCVQNWLDWVADLGQDIVKQLTWKPLKVNLCCNTFIWDRGEQSLSRTRLVQGC